MVEDHREEIVMSFYRVRQALGWLGLLLPLALIVGGLLSLGEVEPSISDYYHTVLRDIFVGTMCAIAIFLISYTGYKREPGEMVSDDIVSTVAGFAAFGVAFFPNEGTVPQESLASVSQMLLGWHGAALGHYISAFVFLSCLGYICLVKFAKTAKPVRKRIYRGCGWTILAMTLGVVVASLLKINGPPGPQKLVIDWMLVLWFEAGAVWAFSIAWLTKGKADLSLAKFVPKGRRKRGAAALPARVTPGE